MNYQKSLFIFRRDLRLEDNTGLIALLSQSKTVVPAFIFDDRQTQPNQNGYFSPPAFAFLLHSLAELDESLRALGSRLYVFSGNPEEIVKSLITNDQIEAVFVNKDYTPFSRRRDADLADLCEKQQVAFKAYADIALSPLEDIRTGSDALYSVFTPFKNKAQSYAVPLPQKNSFSNYYSGEIQSKTISLSQVSAAIGDRKLVLRGGRQEGLEILKKQHYLKNYKELRDFPAVQGTSRLSAHHKFGTISIRESYQVAAEYGLGSQYVSELYWRDFYYYIAYHFPHVFQTSFLPWAEYLEWANKKDHFEAWCAGKTGVPIVDAAMRELNHTGWMHNRARMIVASYLTKNLLIHWQWGEKYFAQNLIDYDPAQNNGGWQWSASTGADPRPLRIFNPYIQAQKFAPQAEYIKQWVPELRELDVKILTNGKEEDFSAYSPHYPAPLVDQKETYHRTMNVYKNAKKEWAAKGF